METQTNNDININIYDLQFTLKCIKVDKWRYGLNYEYEVLFNNKVKTRVLIPKECLCYEDIIINKLKEDRIIKGLITRELNKRIKARREKLKEATQ
jgi:hypothetical protein